MIRSLADLPPEDESPRRRREALDAAFENQVYRQLLDRMRHRFAERSFWLDLCPGMAVSDHPFRPAPAPSPIPEGLPAECAEMVALDGYFVTPPLVRSDDAAKVLQATLRLAAAGYPTGFASVYDEYWRLFAGLRGLLEPLLGAGCAMVPDGLWTFLVPPGDPGRSGWSSLAPHRDAIGPDAHLLATGQPSILNAWIALTDATPLSSCMYVLPASLDEGYATREPLSAPQVPLQDVRALPAPAGSVLGWTSHLLHWGGRSSPRAAGPRVSAALYLQREDVEPFADDVVSFADVVPFEQRVSWVAQSMGMPALFDL
jgi:hypothetical protein